MKLVYRAVRNRNGITLRRNGHKLAYFCTEVWGELGFPVPDPVHGCDIEVNFFILGTWGWWDQPPKFDFNVKNIFWIGRYPGAPDRVTFWQGRPPNGNISPDLSRYLWDIELSDWNVLTSDLVKIDNGSYVKCRLTMREINETSHANPTNWMPSSSGTDPTASNSMRAYPDPKCVYGYMTICEQCLPNAPKYVDVNTPLPNPPAQGKKQRCELCDRKFTLS